jgi:septal ring factor EnvC (AmiA/AmiB activator)
MMNPAGSAGQTKLHEIFDSFNKAWMGYWESYVALQNQLDDSIRAAREVQWLAATDQGKLSEVNRLQRELFTSMPRRLDYTPLGQVSQDLDSAPSKIEELVAALSSEEESCKKMLAGIASLKTQIQAMKEALQPFDNENPVRH